MNSRYGQLWKHNGGANAGNFTMSNQQDQRGLANANIMRHQSEASFKVAPPLENEGRRGMIMPKNYQSSQRLS